MDLEKIRKRSVAKAEKLGYQTNPHLPLLDEDLSLRPENEIIERSLALFAVVATSYGFDKKSAISWLEREGVYGRLAASEKGFLLNDDGDCSFIQKQVEGLNAFSWSLGITKTLEFDQVCSNDLITLFPDLKQGDMEKLQWSTKPG
jgi:hypothetical protein